jgi:hypothetical protein
MTRKIYTTMVAAGTMAVLFGAGGVALAELPAEECPPGSYRTAYHEASTRAQALVMHYFDEVYGGDCELYPMLNSHLTEVVARLEERPAEGIAFCRKRGLIDGIEIAMTEISEGCGLDEPPE